MFKKKIWLILIGINAVLAFFVLFIAPKSPVPHWEYSKKNLFYSSDSPTENPKDTRLLVFKDCPTGSLLKFKFSADFFPKNNGYNNLFQTGEEGSVIRVEIQPDSNLVLVVWDVRLKGLQVLPLASHLELNRWHQIQLHFEEKSFLRVSVDGTERLALVGPSLRPEITDFVVGAGCNRTRLFEGRLKAVAFEVLIEGEGLFVKVLRKVGGMWEWLILVQILILLTIQRKIHILIDDLSDSGSWAILPFLGMVILAALIWIIGKRVVPPTSTKWALFLFIGGSAALLILRERFYGKRWVNFPKINGVAFWGTILIFLVIFLTGLKRFQSDMGRLWVFWLLGSLFFLIKGSSLKFKFFVSFFLMTGFMSLTELPNAVVMKNDLDVSPTRTLIFSAFILLVLAKYLFRRIEESNGLRYNFIVYPLSISLFVLFSFRTDSLFVASTEFHWSYFSEVIESIRSGGLLLWDTPSQYGFLSILFAVILPIKSGVQSLFILYAIMLITVSILFFHSLAFKARSLPYQILMAAIVFSSVFFADPALIGPQPYPSSSMLRFFWCYVLFLFVFLSRNTKWFGSKIWYLAFSILWVLGSLWSAESLIYCGLIFFAISFFIFFLVPGAKKIGFFVGHLCIPAGLFVGVVGGIAVYYRLKSGQFPDWEMGFMYGRGYAKGFGEIPLNWWGTPWALIFPFFGLLYGLLFTMKRLRSERNTLNSSTSGVVLVAGLAWIFAISSYYLGRAVPNNITAMLPQIICILLLTGLALEQDGFGVPSNILKIICLPFVFLVLCTGLFGNSFPEKLKKMNFFIDVKSNTFQAPKDLQVLYTEAGIKPEDPVVYYGDPCVLPRWEYQGRVIKSYSSWLPRPLQLLEEPITPQKSKEILMRYISRCKGDGYFIEQKGFLEYRLLAWKSNLSSDFESRLVSQNSNYRIFLYKKKQ